MCVFVFDKRKRPLMPCSERRARVLLERGRAVVHRHHPFTIRLRDRVGGRPNGERTQRKLGAVATRHCVRVAPGDGYGYVKEVL